MPSFEEGLNQLFFTIQIKGIKWYLFRFWYKLTKYNHKHIWSWDFYCKICKYSRQDIDRSGDKILKKKKWKRPKFKHITGDLYKTKWNWYVICPENLKLGIFTDIGIFTFINARYGVEIGDSVQIGSHCSIYSEDTERNLYSSIQIYPNIKIGSHSTILPRDGRTFIIDHNIKAGSVIY